MYCRQCNIGPELSFQQWIIADLANRSNILVHSKQYNHEFKNSYKIQPVDSGDLARGELIKIKFMRFDNKVIGDINESFCR